MSIEEIVRSATSRAGTVRVSNALNPLLWASAVASPTSWLFAYLLRDDLIFRAGDQVRCDDERRHARAARDPLSVEWRMTLKAHLIVFDGDQIDRRSVIEKIDGLGSIENWHFFFSNTMCVASPKPARALAADIRSVLPEVSFVITTVDPNEKGGWLPKAIWDFLNNPTAAKLRLDA